MFEVVNISNTTRHRSDRDGFFIEISLRSLVAETLTADKIKVRLVSLRDASQEIWLETSRPVQATAGDVRRIRQS